MRNSTFLRFLAGLACALPAAAGAQELETVTFNFSGVLYSNFQYRGEAANKGQNKFDLDRAYLNFRIGTSENTQIRITTDVFQQQNNNNDSYYRGWTVRAKYAWLQHTYLKSGDGLTSTGFIGMIPTTFITHEEMFWPRWVALTPLELSGAMSSADVGIANSITLPGNKGELYTTVVNGNGYTSRETDRFKDYQARLSLTPLSGGDGMLKTFTLTGWGSMGNTASQFSSISEGRTRNRYGVFAGVRDPNFMVGGDWISRTDETELGISDDDPMPTETTGSVISAYTHIKPFRMMNRDGGAPLGILFRWDRHKADNDLDPYYSIVIAGLTWDLNKKTAFSVDYQEQTPKDGSAAAVRRTYYMHLKAEF
jgi:hypothetical protein